MSDAVDKMVKDINIALVGDCDYCDLVHDVLREVSERTGIPLETLASLQERECIRCEGKGTWPEPYSGEPNKCSTCDGNGKLSSSYLVMPATITLEIMAAMSEVATEYIGLLADEDPRERDVACVTMYEAAIKAAQD